MEEIIFKSGLKLKGIKIESVAIMSLNFKAEFRKYENVKMCDL